MAERRFAASALTSTIGIRIGAGAWRTRSCSMTAMRTLLQMPRPLALPVINSSTSIPYPGMFCQGPQARLGALLVFLFVGQEAGELRAAHGALALEGAAPVVGCLLVRVLDRALGFTLDAVRLLRRLGRLLCHRFAPGCPLPARRAAGLHGAEHTALATCSAECRWKKQGPCRQESAGA